MEYVEAHPRVLERHPQLTEEDVRKAWDTAFVEAARVGSPNWPEYLRVGFDDKGCEVEMVAAPYPAAPYIPVLKGGEDVKKGVGSSTTRTHPCPRGRETS